MTNAQSCVRLLNGKYDLSKLFCPSYNLFRIEPRVSNPLLLLTILMMFGRTSGAIDFAVILLRRVSREHQFLNSNFLELHKMSKGNSRKGNREAKKPKKETPKVLATANTISNPTRLELGFKKGG